MKYSKPAKRVELVSIGADGLIIDDVLTVKISPKIRWLKKGIGIGDAGLHPAKPLLARFEKLGHPDFFEYFNLKSIEKDGLENLQKVGGDGDGTLPAVLRDVARRNGVRTRGRNSQRVHPVGNS